MVAFKDVELILLVSGLIAQCLFGGAVIYGFVRCKNGIECAFLSMVAYCGVSFMDVIVACSAQNSRAPISLVGCLVLFALPNLVIGLSGICAYKLPPLFAKFAEFCSERQIKKGTSC